jgi:methanogenic corrinoid protein MtbC1
MRPIISNNLSLCRVVDEFYEALLRSSKVDAHSTLNRFITESKSVGRVEDVVVAALERIGSEWEAGDVALSQIYLSGRICEDIMASFLPAANTSTYSSGKCAIALLNDYHMLGKRIVLCALHSAGFIIEDWGRMTVDQVVDKTIESKIDVLLISTLMLASALEVKEVKTRLNSRGFKGKLMVGGAPGVAPN